MTVLTRFLQLVDLPLRRLHLPLQVHDQIHQPIGIDPTLANIVLELLNVHAPSIINLPKSHSASLTDWTATFAVPS